ncbi:MAG: dockerin type I domain-containing protein [Halanaerobiaceae bacterium]
MYKKLFFLIVVLCMLFAVSSYAAESEPYEWKNVKIGGGGFVTSVIADPNDPDVFYARTDVGGPYRWEESSQKWIPLLDWVDASERGLLGIEAIAVDPNEKGKVYMTAGTEYWNQGEDEIGRSAFLKSDDYGETWDVNYVWDDETKLFNVHGNGMGRGNGEALAIDPANSDTMFYGSRNEGLWKSSDNGDSWDKVESFPVDETENGAGISFVKFDPSTADGEETSRIYVGVLRDEDNVFVSEDGGESWSVVPDRPVPEYAERLMPQRIAIRPDGSSIYITFGDGAGPHTQEWDGANDWFNRGAVYEYEVESEDWTDISPQNFIDMEDEDYSDPETYFGCYSGISINPEDPDHMVVSSTSSYRGPQFWRVDGDWEDEWGDNIYVTTDGGETWIPSFEYYWLEGGQEPPAEQMDENGVPWIVGNSIHWISSVQIDPNNPERVFVTSGNGVFMTEDILNYEIEEEDTDDPSYTQETVWKFAGHGIEETVPEDIVSIPDGPMVSVIGDYDGFVHHDVTEYPKWGSHSTEVAGSEYHLGTTTGLAYAPQTDKLAKVSDTRTVESENEEEIPIGPVQYSTDEGETWSVESYTDEPPEDLSGGKVALSADGEVALWMPSEETVMYRHSDSRWSEVDGIDFNGRPVADWVDEDLFYVFDHEEGYMYVSTDKGESFSETESVGTSDFRSARTVPDKEGHIWVPLAETSEDGTRRGGLMRSSDSGESFTEVSGVDYCEAVGFGKAAEDSDYPTVFVYAEIDGELGVFRSTDKGESWVRVNDDDHEYGGLANGEFVRGDLNKFGRVYMSTAGRGIVYGEPTTEEPDDVEIGDINEDNEINSSDVTVLRNYLLGGVSEDSISIEAADVNDDDSIDSFDFTELVNYVLGNIEEL